MLLDKINCYGNDRFVSAAKEGTNILKANLTFREPCILMYSYNKTNQMQQFLKFIFGTEL